MKGCELCSQRARMFCEADGANLCWDCDAKVHRANFLVAKHCRCLLCHVCQSPTSWKASGLELGPTISICATCVRNGKQVQELGHEDEGDRDDFEDRGHEDDDDDTENSEASSDDDYEDEEEDGENQVVPLSFTPPPRASSSSEDLSQSSLSAASGGNHYRSKRIRDEPDLDSDDEAGCSISTFNNYRTSAAESSPVSDTDESTSLGSSRPSKIRRRSEEIAIPSQRPGGEEESRTAAAAILSSLERYQTANLVLRH